MLIVYVIHASRTLVFVKCHEVDGKRSCGSEVGTAHRYYSPNMLLFVTFVIATVIRCMPIMCNCSLDVRGLGWN